MLNYLANINLMYTVPCDKLTTFLVNKAMCSKVKCANQATADYLADVKAVYDDVKYSMSVASSVQPSDLIHIDEDEEQDVRFL